MDLGGHGSSGKNRNDWSIESFGSDVAAVAESIDAENIVLIGHSMGGPVVLEAATQIGNRVIGVIGVDTLKNVTALPMTPQQARDAFAVSAQEFPARTEAFVRNSFFIENSPVRLVDEIATNMAAADPVIAEKSGASLMAYHARDTLRGLQGIAVILINADYSPTDQAALKSTYENSAVRIIEGSGHFVMLEKPTDFNVALRASILEILAAR